MDDRLDYTIDFINTAFDLTSKLPEEHNAGNPCYGKDVAEYITEKLRLHNIDVEYYDEDWGWQVASKIDSNNFFEINIYPWGFLGDESGDEFHLWRLRLCAKQKSKFMGFIPTLKPVKCNDKWKSIIQNILSQDGNRLVSMETNVEWL